MNTEAQNHIKRDARWTFCIALYNWRDQGATESSFKAIAQSMRFNLSDSDVREQIRYLEQLGYCTVEVIEIDKSLFATRTSKLSDLVEFNAACPDSIARPEKKWW